MGKAFRRPQLADAFALKLASLLKENYAVLSSGLMPERAATAKALATQLQLIAKDLPSSPIATLPYARSNFESFLQSLMETYDLYRVSLEKQEVADGEDREILLEALKTEVLLQEMVRMEKHMTACHIKLQAHFYRLHPLFRELHTSRSKLVGHIFELESLRDSYFEDPTQAHVERYLTVASQVRLAPYLPKLLRGFEASRGSVAGLRSQLRDDEDALQVAFMLEAKL